MKETILVESYPCGHSVSTKHSKDCPQCEENIVFTIN